MLGAFVALDIFLFYVFWEMMLLPMYFLIGIWGGKERVYAAMKFFLYTMVGSLLIDRKSTRLNSSHSQISYAVFCLKQKKLQSTKQPPPRPLDPLWLLPITLIHSRSLLVSNPPLKSAHLLTLGHPALLVSLIRFVHL